MARPPAADAGTGAVTSVSARTVLHLFTDFPRWRLPLLTRTELDALGPPPSASHHRVDDIDHRVLEALRADARMPAARLASRLGLPESSVHRRVRNLTIQGVLRTQVVVDPRRLGFDVDANPWMRVPPAALDAGGLRRLRLPPLPRQYHWLPVPPGDEQPALNAGRSRGLGFDGQPGQFPFEHAVGGPPGG